MRMSLFYLKHRDELIADFQEFYGLDFIQLFIEDEDRACVLFSGLDGRSRTMKSHEPSLNWSAEMYLMRAMEHSLRIIWWQQTDEGQKKGGKAPEPIKSPWEIEEEEKAKNEESNGLSFLEILNKPRRQISSENIKE